MDLHLTNNQPSSVEKRTINQVIGTHDPLWNGGDHEIKSKEFQSLCSPSSRGNRHVLLPVLHAIQSRVGWISPGALNYACQCLDIPPAEAFGVADFYTMFSMSPKPPVVMHVCDDIACTTQGADKICQELEHLLGPAGSPGLSGNTTWERSPCLGQCEKAPAALLIAAGRKPYYKILGMTNSKQIRSVLSNNSSKENTVMDKPKVLTLIPQTGRSQLRLLRRIGRCIDPESLDAYKTNHGYQALEKALKLGPEQIIQEVAEAKLVGRGGAAFPAGIKWRAVATARLQPHYVICNADESEPGTFKDRVIMEEDPFSIIEATTIAGLATGSQQGYVYVRGEYPLAYRRLVNAIKKTRAVGLLGNNIGGSDFNFNLDIRVGAGAYICGEETALFNSIEGFRGEPRNKPPYPTDSGLFGSPTLVNNVETLVNVLEIILQGASAYASVGSEKSTGTKLFCLSGHVSQPGIYEVPFGITVRQMIDLAGGVSGSGCLQAVLLGGAAGSFLSPQELNTPLTFEDTQSIGASLGSAVLMLFDDTVDLKKILLRIAAFFRDESCFNSEILFFLPIFKAAKTFRLECLASRL